MSFILASRTPALIPRTHVRTLHSPPPKAAQLAALVARATALIERVDRLGASLSPSKRAQIETELAVVKRLVELLGYRGKA
jgi:hypothetical protein